MSDEGWIEWSGGECPVDPETKVRVELRNGVKDTAPAGQFLWGHSPKGTGKLLDIIAYRISLPQGRTR